MLALPLLAGCSGKQPVDRLIAQLDEQASRERAIDGLLVLIKESPTGRQAGLRKRVAYALTEAYRTDRHRGAIVSALALLKAREGEVVFAAALSDFGRGGEYFEAAIRSARLLGELDIKARIPELVKTLEQAIASPRPDRNTWLERTLLLSLDRLGASRAAPVLIKVLDGDPVSQDFYLNKMAARALGKLRDPAAVPALVRSLGATSHGLLLLEESRRALCRIGGSAIPELTRAATVRDKRGAHGNNASGAMRSLGDLGDVSLLPRLGELAKEKLDDDLRVVLGETLLRLGDAGGKQALLAVLDRRDAPLTVRGEAARLLGLYGAAGDLGQRLDSACKAPDPSSSVLCWRLALAHTRIAGADGGALLDQLAAARQDKTTAQYLSRYRPRLKVPASCAGDGACLRKHLAAPDWRLRERAALELGKGGDEGDAAAMAAQYEREHDQVKQALLIGLERAARQGADAAKLLKALPAAATEAKPGGVTPRQQEASPALRSRLLCLRERLGRATKTSKKTEKR